MPMDAPRANLGGADLTGADLHGTDLTGANLGRADLTGADLIDARWPEHAAVPGAWKVDTSTGRLAAGTAAGVRRLSRDPEMGRGRQSRTTAVRSREQRPR
jgi:Pentapeptide repeats (8 copies)